MIVCGLYFEYNIKNSSNNRQCKVCLERYCETKEVEHQMQVVSFLCKISLFVREDRSNCSNDISFTVDELKKCICEIYNS